MTYQEVMIDIVRKSTEKIGAEVIMFTDGTLCVGLTIPAKYLTGDSPLGRQRIEISDGEIVILIRVDML